MKSTRLRIPSVLLVSAAAAWCAWRYLPSSPVDRFLIRSVAGATANPPFIIAGDGSHAFPWSVRILAPQLTADPAKSPVVVSLADDREGIFQSSPPSPIDLAIVLKNIRRLGAENVAVGAVLAWENPDTIALTALDAELASFRRSVTAAPLSRGATGAPLPQSFRRASLPLSAIKGDASGLPVVNRISLPDVILGMESSLSGFNLLENETEGTPLVARWDDRIVLAFPLVATLARLDIPTDAVEVRLGNHILLGKTGPIIPIDEFGRLTANTGNIAAPHVVRADAVIDATEPFPPTNLVLLRDDQSNAEATTRRFSESLVPLIAGIASDAGMSPPRIFRRASATSELILLGAVSLLIASFFGRSRFVREVMSGIIAAAAISLHFILAATASLWLVSVPLVAAAAAAILFGRIFFREPSVAPAAPVPKSEPPAPAPEPETPAAPPAPEPLPEPAAPEPLPEPVAEEEPEPAKKSATKKTAAKKTAKKAPAKKAAARKAAKKSAGAKNPRKSK